MEDLLYDCIDRAGVRAPASRLVRKLTEHPVQPDFGHRILFRGQNSQRGTRYLSEKIPRRSTEVSL